MGVTSNLRQRIKEHKQKKYSNSFTAKYKVDVLIYYEVYISIVAAIGREKEIKGWTRKKKEALIKVKNPQWNELLI